MAIANSDVKNLSETIINLQKDMAQVGTLVERLDVTIEKLTEVSTRVSQLLAVQGTRIENQEKVSEQIQAVIEKRRIETDTNIKDVYVRVERVEKELYKEIEDSQTKVLQEIKDMRVESTNQHNELKGKVQRLEKWMWTVMGGATVLLFVIEFGLKIAQ